MSFNVIDFGLDPAYASLVTNEDGTVRDFPTLEEAMEEAGDCQRARIICTGLEGHALFDPDCMTGFLMENTSFSEQEARQRLDSYFSAYRAQHEK